MREKIRLYSNCLKNLYLKNFLFLGNLLCVWTFNKKDVELKPSFANLLKCLSMFDTVFLVSFETVFLENFDTVFIVSFDTVFLVSGWHSFSCEFWLILSCEFWHSFLESFRRFRNFSDNSAIVTYYLIIFTLYPLHYLFIWFLSSSQ